MTQSLNNTLLNDHEEIRGEAGLKKKNPRENGNENTAYQNLQNTKQFEEVSLEL
jgi:hypothetical protein